MCSQISRLSTFFGFFSQPATRIEPSNNTFDLFADNIFMLSPGQQLSPEPCSYCWKKGVANVVMAEQDPNNAGFTGQYCAQDKLIVLSPQTGVVLTVPFSGCIFLLCSLEGTLIASHFDNSGRAESYRPLARCIMTQKNSDITRLLEQKPDLPEEESARKACMDNCKKDVENSLVQQLFSTIGKTYCSIPLNPGQAGELVQFPTDFLMRSTFACDDAEDPMSAKQTYTMACMAKDDSGKWNFLAKEQNTKLVNWMEKDGGKILHTYQRQCRPMELNDLYHQALETAGLEQPLTLQDQLAAASGIAAPLPF